MTRMHLFVVEQYGVRHCSVCGQSILHVQDVTEDCPLRVLGEAGVQLQLNFAEPWINGWHETWTSQYNTN